MRFLRIVWLDGLVLQTRNLLLGQLGLVIRSLKLDPIVLSPIVAVCPSVDSFAILPFDLGPTVPLGSLPWH